MPGLTNLADSLSVLQDAITSQLQGLAAFGGYTVRSATDGTVDDIVLQATGTTTLLVTVALPDLARGPRHNVRVASVTITFEEAVQRNRVGTYQTARSLALEAQNALCGWRPDGGWTPLEFEAQTTTRQQPTLILSLRLSTQLQLSDS